MTFHKNRNATWWRFWKKWRFLRQTLNIWGKFLKIIYQNLKVSWKVSYSVTNNIRKVFIIFFSKHEFHQKSYQKLPHQYHQQYVYKKNAWNFSIFLTVNLCRNPSMNSNHFFTGQHHLLYMNLVKPVLECLLNSL